ncbi:NTP transferase domain-containing protein, partial [Francisella tularensis]|uniref:NTP transferase domain-containing protein n=1 Tax=Francisella tularensis TaxID=263 RepID=UPI002381C783
RNITFVYQQQQLGTGHSVLQALTYLKEQKVLILYGDVPLISTEVLENLVDNTNDDDLFVISSFVYNHLGLGRIVSDKFGEV